jgi:hypothetical protein
MESTQEVVQPMSDQEADVFMLKQQVKRGANWFYWIAGLSVVNSIILMVGQEMSFIVGLGATQLIDGVVLGMLEETNMPEWIKYVALVMDVLVATIYVMFGYLANKGYKAGFIAGMILYALDGLIFLLVMDVMSMAFHGFAMFCIFGGLKALGQLRQLPPAVPMQPMASS